MCLVLVVLFSIDTTEEKKRPIKKLNLGYWRKEKLNWQCSCLRMIWQ